MGMLARVEPVGVLCARFGVSRQIAYKFLKRFQRKGWSGLRDLPRGRRPRGDPTWKRFRAAVLARRRRRPHWGARKLPALLKSSWPDAPASERTINRWLKAAELVPKRTVVRRWRPGPARSRRPRRPNDLWTMDWKGWFYTDDGARIEPLTVRDAVSRLVLWTLPLPARSDQAVRKVCRWLFRRYGQPRAIRVDRGAPFCGPGPYGLTSLSVWWTRLGIRVEFVHRRARIDNNAHEQLHRVLKAATASPPARTAAIQRQRLRRWQHEYNSLRPHDELAGRTPAQCHRLSSIAYAEPPTPRYPPSWTVRWVHPQGYIALCGVLRHIGRAFAGLPAGCKPVRNGFQIYCDHLHLGRLNHGEPHLLPHPNLKFRKGREPSPLPQTLPGFDQPPTTKTVSD